MQKPFNENLLLAELGRVLRNKSGPGQILLVEKDDELAQAIMVGFEDSGVRLDHASTLEEATDRCLLSAPDLLILDLTLPDGEWLLAGGMAAALQPTLEALPLVVYSSREISEADYAEASPGADGVPGQGEGPAQSRWKRWCSTTVKRLHSSTATARSLEA